MTIGDALPYVLFITKQHKHLHKYSKTGVNNCLINELLDNTGGLVLHRAVACE